MLSAITVLLLFQMAGEIIIYITGLPVPGPVIGMLLLFFALLLRGRLDENLQTTSIKLLKLLGLLFVPAGSGIIAYGSLIRKEWLALSLTLIFSTFLTMAVTALVMQFIARRKESDHGKH